MVDYDIFKLQKYASNLFLVFLSNRHLRMWCRFCFMPVNVSHGALQDQIAQSNSPERRLSPFFAPQPADGGERASA